MKHLSLLAAGSALLCTCPLTQANSMPPTLLVDQAGLVLMVDGKDQNSASVAFEITARKLGSRLDFGFMTGGMFSSLGSGSRKKQSLALAGGVMVDFAVRNQGADGRFGTSDDQIFRLSDPAHYANQYYSSVVSPWKSIDPGQPMNYYRNLSLFWDVNHDGITDMKVMLHTRNGHDGMRFDASATPVPLPAAAWLLGVGLAGLAALARRRERFDNR